MGNMVKGIVAIGVFALFGCDATPNTPPNFEAAGYQYKGAADPLLEIPVAERAGSLAERFDKVQGRM